MADNQRSMEHRQSCIASPAAAHAAYPTILCQKTGALYSRELRA